MPAYAFLCSQCKHPTTVPMRVNVFKARVSEARAGDGKWPHLSCPRCGSRRGRGKLVFDFVGQARTQVVQNDEYTFYENAPDAILQGQQTRTVTKAEAARLMKEHSLADAGKAGKHRTPDSMLKTPRAKTADRWAAEEAAARTARVEAVLAESCDKVAEKAPPVTTESQKTVDTLSPEGVRIATEWPALKRQAASLGIKVRAKYSRAVLEPMVRDELQKQAAP